MLQKIIITPFIAAKQDRRLEKKLLKNKSEITEKYKTLKKAQN